MRAFASLVKIALDAAELARWWRHISNPDRQLGRWNQIKQRTRREHLARTDPKSAPDAEGDPDKPLDYFPDPPRKP